MFLKLWALSLGPLLIINLSAQLVQSQYAGDQDCGGRCFFTHSSEQHHHHRHHHNDGPGTHHGHFHNPNQFYDGHPGAPQFRAGQNSGFGGNSHEMRFPGPHGAGHRDYMSGGGFGAPQGAGFRPGVGFGGHRHGVGYGGQPGGGYYDQPRPGYRNQPGGEYYDQPRPGYGRGPFQPRPNQPDQSDFQHNPHSTDQNTPELSFQTPGNADNPLQQLPGQRRFDLNMFQQPGNEQYGNDQSSNAGHPLEPRPGQSGNPIQPLPQSADKDSSKINFQTPGNAGNPLQPRPEQGTFDSNVLQQPAKDLSGNSRNSLQPRPEQGSFDSNVFPQPAKDLSGSAGNPLQPRPEQGSFDSNVFPQPAKDLSGSAGNPLQPRPGQGTFDSNVFPQPAVDQSGNADKALQPRPEHGTTDSFPQPGNDQSGNIIQPLPTDYSKFHFQQPREEVSSNPIQPLPGQGFNQNPQDVHTIKPHPNPASNPTDGTVEDNIAAIFNTKDFISPQLFDENHGPKDPMDQSKVAKTSTDVRILLDTDKRCGTGLVLMGGHCRSPA